MNQLALDLRQEKTRLSRQCETIIGRLCRGRTSNFELYEIALNATARISELRKKGHHIRIVARDHRTGENWYALFVNGKEVGL